MNGESQLDVTANNPVHRVHREVLRAIAEIRFGSVEITVHDGKVVQIERKEKIRFPKEGT